MRLTREQREALDETVEQLGTEGTLTAYEELVQYLEERQQVYLQTINRISRQSISPEEAAEMKQQIAALVAEVGTLRSQLRSTGLSLLPGDEAADEIVAKLMRQTGARDS